MPAARRGGQGSSDAGRAVESTARQLYRHVSEPNDCSIPINELIPTVLSKAAKGVAYILMMILRHTARKDGLHMDADCYVLLDDLLKAKRVKASGTELNVQDARNIAFCDKNKGIR